MRFRQLSGAKNSVGACRPGDMVGEETLPTKIPLCAGIMSLMSLQDVNDVRKWRSLSPDAVPEAYPQISGGAVALAGRILVGSLPTLCARAAFFLEIAGIVA